MGDRFAALAVTVLVALVARCLPAPGAALYPIPGMEALAGVTSNRQRPAKASTTQGKGHDVVTATIRASALAFP